jgi:predicted AAA+ superfamily ATPase
MIIIHGMNDKHSYHEPKYKKRWIASVLREASEEHPVVVLTGARQVGKSTLLRNEPPFRDWRYVSLDDFDVLSQAEHDPASLWAGAECVVLDEIHKSPNVLNAVKASVDKKRRTHRFVLSGSANLLLMKSVSESLAGRAIYYVLGPMTTGEIIESPPPELLRILFDGRFPKEQKMVPPTANLLSGLWKGFLPPLMKLEKPSAILSWWEGYVATFLERDLRQLSQIDSLSDFRKAMAALALRCGNVLNQSEIARDTGISQPTFHRYLNLMETTCLVERLPAFSVNRTKRLTKSPKMMWEDPGLVSFLSGHFDAASLGVSREVGGVFESMIFLHLSALCQLLVPRPRVFYWRTTAGKEVDFVLEWGRKLLALEVKLSSEPRFSDTEGLRLFLEEYPETSACVLIHTGNEIKMMHDKIIAIPWYALAGG